MPAGHLDRPFSPEERLACQRAYVRHQGLIRTLGRQLTQKYSHLDPGDVFSCIDVAFLKAFRVYTPAKGQFSTLLLHFSVGAIRHFLRDQHPMVRVPRRQHELIEKARRRIDTGTPAATVFLERGIDPSLYNRAMELERMASLHAYDEEDDALHAAQLVEGSR